MKITKTTLILVFTLLFSTTISAADTIWATPNDHIADTIAKIDAINSDDDILPANKKTQIETLVSNFMDFYIQTNDYGTIALFKNRIDNGNYPLALAKTNQLLNGNSTLKGKVAGLLSRIRSNGESAKAIIAAASSSNSPAK